MNILFILVLSVAGWWFWSMLREPPREDPTTRRSWLPTLPPPLPKPPVRVERSQETGGGVARVSTEVVVGPKPVRIVLPAKPPIVRVEALSPAPSPVVEVPAFETASMPHVAFHEQARSSVFWPTMDGLALQQGFGGAPWRWSEAVRSEEGLLTLDLHGLSCHHAGLALRRFLADAQAFGVRSVRVITGRGSHSAGLSSGETPPLLEATREVLEDVRGMLVETWYEAGTEQEEDAFGYLGYLDVALSSLSNRPHPPRAVMVH